MATPKKRESILANVNQRYDRYTSTFDYQILLNSYQFPRAKRRALEGGLTFTDPTVTYTDRLTLDDDERPIEVFAAADSTPHSSLDRHARPHDRSQCRASDSRVRRRRTRCG